MSKGDTVRPYSGEAWDTGYARIDFSSVRKPDAIRAAIVFEEADKAFFAAVDRVLGVAPGKVLQPEWSVTDVSRAHSLPDLEFQAGGEWHHFHLLRTPARVVFGGCCNIGFIESGYIEREEGETLDETLQELVNDLECYYNDGPGYVSRIVCNERM